MKELPLGLHFSNEASIEADYVSMLQGSTRTYRSARAISLYQSNNESMKVLVNHLGSDLMVLKLYGCLFNVSVECIKMMFSAFGKLEFFQCASSHWVIENCSFEGLIPANLPNLKSIVLLRSQLKVT